MSTLNLPKPVVKTYVSVENLSFKNNPIFIHNGIFIEENNYKEILQKFSNSTQRNIYVLDSSSRSSKLKNEFHILELVSDLLYLIEKKAESKVILIGHGIGSKACSLVAQLYPNLIEKLIITGVNPIKKYSAVIKYKRDENEKEGLYKSDSYDENSKEEDNFEYINLIDQSKYDFKQKRIIDITINNEFSGETLLVHGGQYKVFSKQDYDSISKIFVNCKFECLKKASYNSGHEFSTLFLKKVESFLDHDDQPYLRDKIVELITENNHISTHKIAEKLNIHQSTVVALSKNAGYFKKTGVWFYFPETILNWRVNNCKFLLRRIKKKSFLKRIIAEDEKWIYFEKKSHEKFCNNKIKFNQTVSKPKVIVNKVLFCVWWDYKGIIHSEFLSPGQSRNSTLFCTQLERLKEEVKKKRPELLNNAFFHYCPSEFRDYYLENSKILEFGWKILDHTFYSPDLNPSSFHFFKPLQKFLDDKMLSSKKDCEFYVKKYFEDKNPEYFAEGISLLPSRWEKIIKANGHFCND